MATVNYKIYQAGGRTYLDNGTKLQSINSSLFGYYRTSFTNGNVGVSTTIDTLYVYASGVDASKFGINGDYTIFQKQDGSTFPDMPTLLAYLAGFNPGSGGGTTTLSTPTVAATNVSSTENDLSWGAVTNATSYDIYRGGMFLANQAGTTYKDMAAPSGTTSNYSVYAKATGYNTSSPGTASATTPVAPSTYDTVQTFTNSNKATNAGVTTTVPSANSTDKMEFNAVPNWSGSPMNMTVTINGVQVQSTDFPSDYVDLGRTFRVRGTYIGNFTDGTVNF